MNKQIFLGNLNLTFDRSNYNYLSCSFMTTTADVNSYSFVNGCARVNDLQITSIQRNWAWKLDFSIILIALVSHIFWPINEDFRKFYLKIILLLFEVVCYSSSINLIFYYFFLFIVSDKNIRSFLFFNMKYRSFHEALKVKSIYMK